MPVVLDIGKKNVKILKGQVNKKNNIVITDVAIEPTPEGAVENGQIKNHTELSLFLRSIISKHNMGKQNCYVNVRSSDIAAREFTVPAIKGNKLVKVIQNEIDSFFGNTSDYYVDYAITDTVVVDYKNLHKVMAYAVPKNIVISYYDLLNTIDLRPVAFDVHRNALSKLLKDNVLINQAAVTDKVMIFVDLGGAYMDLDLVVDNKSVFKRSVPIEEELNMDDDTSAGFTSDYESVQDSDDGYSSYLNSDLMSDYGDYGASSGVSPVFVKANEELYKMMQFAISREGGKPVTNIYLYGGNSRLKGLDQYLATTLDVGVEKIFNVSNIEVAVEADVSDIIIASGSFIRM